MTPEELWAKAAAEAIAGRLDGDDITVDGEDWAVEETIRPGEVLLLASWPARTVRARVCVEFISGAIS